MENNYNSVEREFSWDDVIIVDDSEFVLLPEGDYNFKVTKFERGRHSGSEKLPPCNKAILTLEIDGQDKGKTTIIHNLFLHSKCEGMLSAFFRSIGQKKHGEQLRMNWQAVTGATGRCHVFIDNYKNKNGEDRQSNKIKKFYDPETVDEQPKKTFTPGKF